MNCYIDNIWSDGEYEGFIEMSIDAKLFILIYHIKHLVIQIFVLINIQNYIISEQKPINETYNSY